MQQAKHTYEALNKQLLDELPKLASYTSNLMGQLLARLLQLQQEVNNAARQRLEHLLGVQLLSDDCFNDAHHKAVEKLSHLSFCPKTFNPTLPEERPRSNSKVIATYPRSKGSLLLI